MIRARLETTEREKENLLRQLQGSASSQHPPHAVAELHSQLERVNKQLFFKDQEVLNHPIMISVLEAPNC